MGFLLIERLVLDKRDSVPWEGMRKVWLAYREVYNLSGRWRLFYFDSFSFPCEAKER